MCYTSGTTGDPKGAIITQGNCVSLIAAIAMGSAPVEENVESKIGKEEKNTKENEKQSKSVEENIEKK